MTRHIGYKFVEADLTRRGVQYRVGEWTDPIPDPIPCDRGYHYCPDPLDLITNHGWQYGPVMLLVEADGPGVREGDKVAASRLYVHQVLPWTDRTARLFAADCAERVLSMFGRQHPDDARHRLAIAAARQYAEGRIPVAAWAAAWDAAWDAARAATWTAAEAAAGAAERDWQRARLRSYLAGHLPKPLAEGWKLP